MFFHQRHRHVLVAVVVAGAAAALGTVGHELGHWCAAWLAGCAPVLHFAWVTPGCPAELHPALRHLGVAGGPVSSMLAGTLGMVLLNRWRSRGTTLDVEGVAYTVLALFWSRPLFNLLVQLSSVGCVAQSTSLCPRASPGAATTSCTSSSVT